MVIANMDKAQIFTPIKLNKEKLAVLVIDRIKDALIRGQLKPGDKLPAIADLAAELNVGISSVREAIKMLEALCVVECRHGGRTVICSELKEDSINPLTYQLLILPKNSKDLIEFREMFESAYTFMAMDNASDSDMENIRLIVESQKEKDKTLELIDQDEMDFHRAILHSTHNKYVIKIGETMLELLLGTFQKWTIPKHEYTGIKVIESHISIYEALKTKNKTKLHNALNESYRGWRMKFF